MLTLHACRYLQNNKIVSMPERIFQLIPKTAPLLLIDLRNNPLTCHATSGRARIELDTTSIPLCADAVNMLHLFSFQGFHFGQTCSPLWGTWCHIWFLVPNYCEIAVIILRVDSHACIKWKLSTAWACHGNCWLQGVFIWGLHQPAW